MKKNAETTLNPDPVVDPLDPYMDYRGPVMPEPKIVPPSMETKCDPIEKNYGQIMPETTSMDASKPWKPKGRK